MNCKKGDMARVVDPVIVELRGRTVVCVALVYSFFRGKVQPSWITEREHSFTCPGCGGRHTTDRFFDFELRPLPGDPTDETIDEHADDEVTA